MDTQRFCDWLQGYIEMGGGPPNEQQWEMVKRHLALVFNKVTPPLRYAPNKGWEDKVVEGAPPAKVDPLKDKEEKTRDSGQDDLTRIIDELHKKFPLKGYTLPSTPAPLYPRVIPMTPDERPYPMMPSYPYEFPHRWPGRMDGPIC